jgi:hypothetical protein
MTEEIGSQAEAQAAFEAVEMHHSFGEPIPAGFAVVGRGRSRIALRSVASDVVYKVPCDAALEANGAKDNRVESYTYRVEWAGRDYCPRATLHWATDQYGDHVAVLAMEYLENDGSEPRNLDEVLGALASLGALDLNNGNWITRDGKAIVIDCAGI